MQIVGLLLSLCEEEPTLSDSEPTMCSRILERVRNLKLFSKQFTLFVLLYV